MPACTFFGHRDCDNSIAESLHKVLKDLILSHNVDMFYVGNQGQFDALVRRTLRTLSQEFPHIQYAVVLAYLPTEPKQHFDYSDTMLPEGIETVHPRYAISWRNDWLLRNSQFVVSYITHPWGGAAKYVEKAKRMRKCVIPLP